MAATAPTEPVFYNPFEPGYAEDPYRQFALLREHDPVQKSTGGAVDAVPLRGRQPPAADALAQRRGGPPTRVGPGPRVFERLLAQSEQGEERRSRGTGPCSTSTPRPHPPAPPRLKGLHPRMIGAAPPWPALSTSTRRGRRPPAGWT